MYDNLAHLAALAHEAEVRRVAASPAQQLRHQLPRPCRRWLRRVPCPQAV